MFAKDSNFPVDDEIHIMFHALSIDWYDIAGQLPEIHKHFKLPAPPPQHPMGHVGGGGGGRSNQGRGGGGGYTVSISYNLRRVGRGDRPWHHKQHWNTNDGGGISREQGGRCARTLRVGLNRIIK